mmetsp:Transcript_52374/g.125084  ORF Transcript_52374/g.125084 Transcript_52374/m.125084 type:complete len:327 (+) Transcript_52374:77-1057(+)
MERAQGLSFWQGGKVEIRPVNDVREELHLGEGRTNQNFIATTDSARYFIRIGKDLPYFGVARVREQAASRAAEVAGLAPVVAFTELPDVLVLKFVEGRALTEDALHAAAASSYQEPTLQAITSAIRALHQLPVPAELRAFAEEVSQGRPLGWGGPHLAKWLAYAEKEGYCRIPLLTGLRDTIAKLEAAAGPTGEEVFCHFDLLPDNLVMCQEGGVKLVDFEYSAPGQALMDLAVLAMGCSLSSEEEQNLLSSYLGALVTDEQHRAFKAVRVLAALRETFWGVTAELSKTSALPIEEAKAYVDMNYAKFCQLLGEFEASTAASPSGK